MTAATLVERPPVLGVRVAPLDAPVSSGDDLGDRDYFNGCVTPYTVAPYVAMVGPLSATPQRSLADVVWSVMERAA